MFNKKKSLDYKTCSPAREEFFMNVESVLKEKGINYSREQLYELVDAYSGSDTETMSRIFLDIIKNI